MATLNDVLKLQGTVPGINITQTIDSYSKKPRLVCIRSQGRISECHEIPTLLQIWESSAIIKARKVKKWVFWFFEFFIIYKNLKI